MKKQYTLSRLRFRTCGRFDYVIRGGGASLRDCSTNRDELYLPETLDGLPLTSVGRAALLGSEVRCVTLPPTVTSIGSCAFACCDELRLIVIPESVRCIHDNAFMETPDVTLCVAEGSYAHRYAQVMGLPFCHERPAESYWAEDTYVCGDYLYRVTEEGEAVIREYNGPEETLYIPDALGGCPVVQLDSWAFSGNTALKAVIVPEGVTTVGSFAFSGCRQLRSVRLPDSVTAMGSGCFNCCWALEEAVLPAALELLPMQTFFQCRSLREVTLPGGMRSICGLAFGGCCSLRQIWLNEGLEEVSDSAFFGCRSLQMPQLPRSLQAESRSAFQHCIGWPGGEEEAQKGA